MGIQIPDFDDPNFGANDDDDDGDLEAELKLLQQDAGGSTSKRPKANQKKSGALFFVRIFNRKRMYFEYEYGRVVLTRN
jgi:hypothetical protein